MILAGLISCWLLLAAAAQAQPASAPATAPATSTAPASEVVLYQPGVRIRFARRQVELDAEVTLREGPLELFACSPRTREYESIVCVTARPLHIYQALGLVGLTPGRPVRVNQRGRLEPAHGQPVRIQVCWDQAGPRCEPIEAWMRRSDSDALLEPQSWVFAGSQPLGGGLTADDEGTVIAVVDFSSAIIALPASHTDRNAELWLAPRTPAIPPKGTKCTLVLEPGPLSLEILPDGRLRLNGRLLLLGQVAAELRAMLAEEPELPITLRVSAGVAGDDERLVRNLLVGLGIPDARVQVIKPQAPASQPAQAAESAARPGDPLALAQQLQKLGDSQAQAMTSLLEGLADRGARLQHSVEQWAAALAPEASSRAASSRGENSAPATHVRPLRTDKAPR